VLAACDLESLAGGTLVLLLGVDSASLTSRETGRPGRSTNEEVLAGTPLLWYAGIGRTFEALGWFGA
jgi:hypothetical protein